MLRDESAYAVIGAGLMGTGIAKVLLRAGHAVRIYDADHAASTHAARRLEAVGRISATGSIREAVDGGRVIFEAVAEHLESKLELFAEVQRHNEAAPIASNTSTFMPGVLSRGLHDPGRLLIAHFFNPADTVPLVEVVPSAQTRASATQTVIEVLENAGKVPVLLGREAPGFVGNRLQAAVLREALAIVRQGIATFEQVDQVVTASLGRRWSVAGPFTIADLGGLDVFAALAEQLFPVLDDAARTPAELTDRVARGDLGAKTGVGFFEYPAERLSRLEAMVRDAFGSPAVAARPSTRNGPSEETHNMN